MLKTNRGVIKIILLSIITFGIYGLYVTHMMAKEANLVDTNGKKIGGLLAVIFLSMLTLGIYGIVWQHKYCNRIGNELKRRGINYAFSAKTYWGWGILGALIFVGPFVYGHKHFKAMNLMNDDYNRRG